MREVKINIAPPVDMNTAEGPPALESLLKEQYPGLAGWAYDFSTGETILQFNEE